jgi:phthiocerol/phenolphthiocerol synthesis type-I polyketide synthase E
VGVEPIAIVGMAARVPDAGTVEEFWANLLAGRHSIHRLTERQLLDAGEDLARIRADNYVPARPLLDDVWGFDNEYFGVSRRESELRNPQHRLFLELCETALQNSTVVPDRFDGSIGVYGGCATDRFLEDHVRADPRLLEQIGETVALVSNNVDFMPAYVAYRLGLRGPAIAVRTACSTSLVAVHLACQALRSGDCDLALAGGVEIETPYGRGYLHTEGGIDSADGRCRPLDAEASGTVFGNGGGVVALKRLSDAKADGDDVVAVILGSAVSNDGAERASFTAPSSVGQCQAIAEAIAVAGLDSAHISYVELHGTGTKVGDPVEIRGLHDAMTMTARSDLRPDSCWIGSVKSNLGHLGPGSGVVGLIKTALALRHRTIPPTIGVREVNPLLKLDSTPFAVADAVRPWPRVADRPRRAGVSSFGFGGINAHAVLEEAPAAPSPVRDDEPQLLVWSGLDDEKRTEVGTALLRTAVDADRTDLAAIARASQIGRRALKSRAALRVNDLTTANEALSGSRSVLRGDGRTREPLFLFPGQGAQFPQMYQAAGRWLPGHAASSRDHLSAFSDLLGVDLIAIAEHEQDPAVLARTMHAQPLLFAVELAAAQSLIRLGARPAAVVGHSVGEIVAATVAGVFAVDDAIRFVAERARLMQRMPPGVMAVVAAPVAEVRHTLVEGVWVSAANGAEQTVVGGSAEAVARYCAMLDELGVKHRRLSTSHAFHTPMMGEAVPEFLETVAKMRLTAPTLPMVSAASGRLLDAQDAVRPEFWVSQLVEPVLFHDALSALPVPDPIVVECGPSALGGLARRHPAVGGAGHPVVDLLDPSAQRHVLDALGELWVHGINLQFADLPGEQRRSYSLPTYPYRRTEFLLPDRSRAGTPTPPVGVPVSGSAAESPTGLALPVWRPSPAATGGPAVQPAALGHAVVLLPGDSSAAARVRRVVQRAGYQVLPISPGTELDLQDYGSVVRPSQAGDVTAALDLLGHSERITLAVDARGYGPVRAGADPPPVSLPPVLQWAADRAVPVLLLTTGAVGVTPAEPREPERVTVAALVHEAPPGTVRLLDVAAASDQVVAAEIAAPAIASPVLALRGGQLWHPDLMPYEPPPAGSLLEREGRYAITGGTTPAGLALARALADTGLQPRVVLPIVADPEPWARRELAALRAAGVEVELIRGGVESVLDEPLDGIFHVPGEGDWAGEAAAAAACRDLAVATPSIRFVAFTGPGVGGHLGALAAAAGDYRTTVLALDRSLAGVGEEEAAGALVRLLRPEVEPHVVMIGRKARDGERAERPVRAFGPAADLIETVRAMWAETLGSPHLADDTDFYAAGGDSLTAVQMVSRLQERLAVALSPAELQQAPTARGLATLIREKLG